MMRKKLLLVDDEPSNLQLLRQILKDDYRLFFVPDGPRALEAAVRHQPDLILLDIMMPGMDGYEVCHRLKANPLTHEIPVIFVTAMGEVQDESRGFDAGAVDYIQKPVSPPIVLRRVETHLSLVRAKEFEDSQREAIQMLGEAGHFHDTDTGAHIWRMAAYARALAEETGWPEDHAERMELAAPMHDTGKIGTPHHILQAPRKLSAEEWVIMREHTTIGYHILCKCDTPIFTMAAEIALRHHERWDGSGYPGGLAGEDIPISARIIAVADVFDALTSRRPYKKAWPVEDAVETIRASAGSHFDPTLAHAFLGIMPRILELKQAWDARETRAPDGSMVFVAS